MAKHTTRISSTSILIGVLAVFVGVLSILFVQQQSSAKNDDSERHVSSKQCNTDGEPVINVEQKIVNDADSGEAGNY